MGMGFSSERGEVPGQMTLDGLVAGAARSAAREEVKDALRAESPKHTGDRIDVLRDELGSLTKLTPMERYALIQLARALAKGMGKKGIKKRVKALLGE